MNKFLATTVACALFAGPAAFANQMAQTHHCEMDGKEVVKTHKDCKASGGKWMKGGPTTAAVPAPPNTTVDASRSPAVNKALPANTPPTPNGNGTVTPAPGDRTPGN